jgi:putative transposase
MTLLKKHEKNLARKQQKLARKVHGSKTRQKAKKLVAKVHARISNARNAAPSEARNSF